MARRGGERTLAQDSKLDDIDMAAQVFCPETMRGYYNPEFKRYYSKVAQILRKTNIMGTFSRAKI